MTQSTFTYKYTTGARRGVKYEIGVRHDPDINDVQSFAVILFFQLRDGTRVEVVKIDDSEHQAKDDSIHIDRYYRELGADIKDFNLNSHIGGWEDAEKHLQEKWKRFADQYYENHGKKPREDEANIGRN